MVQYNLIDTVNYTPLTFAIAQDKNEAVNILIANNANLDLHDGDGDTPLTRAIVDENIDVLKLLIENGADVNLIDSENYTPLNFAIYRFFLNNYSCTYHLHHIYQES